jgi:hypothetical protein
MKAAIVLMSLSHCAGCRAPEPPPPRVEAPRAPRCAPVDEARREAMEGSLRRARDLLEIGRAHV